jgi:Carboxypeptidase regulatory-like domain
LAVVANTPKTLPNQIMRNACQLRGTVVSEGKGDSLIGAKVEVRKKSDNALVASRMADAEGHFSFGVVAGDYVVNVTYQGKTLNPPVSVAITQSLDLKKLVFKQTVRLILPGKVSLGQMDGTTQELYDLKGSTLVNTLPLKSIRSTTILIPWTRKD